MHQVAERKLLNDHEHKRNNFSKTRVIAPGVISIVNALPGHCRSVLGDD